MALNANALTLYATAKSDLGLANDTDQAAVERCINAGSSAIESYCGRKFGKGTVTEKLRGSANPLLLVSRPPIVSITSIKIDDSSIASTEYSIDDATTGLIYREHGWSPTHLLETSIERTPVPGSEKPRYEVVYVGGWVLPKDAVAGVYDLPADVEEACIKTAVSIFRRRGSDGTIASESLGDASVSYFGANPSSGRMGHVIPDDALKLLEPYRRMTG